MRRFPGRSRSFAAVALAAVLSLAGSSRAEDIDVKQQLAWELMQVAGGGDMAQQLTDVILASMRQNYVSMVQQLLAAQPSLTAQQRSAVEARLANYDRFSRKFSSRLNEKIDFDALLRDIQVPLYAEHFTESELREILAFQKSAVGRKASALLPKLMQEGMQGMMPTVQPVVLSVLEEVLREEQALALEGQ